MKSCAFVLAAALLVSVVSAGENEFKEHGKMCAEKIGIDAEHIKDLIGSARDGDADAEKQLGCFHACMLEQMGMLDGTTLNEDKIKEMIAEKIPDKKDQLIEKAVECIAEAKDLGEPCEIGHKFGKCLMPELKKEL